ncbi:MAG: phosphoribosyltransferase-like protein [Chlamydiia bacterium]
MACRALALTTLGAADRAALENEAQQTIASAFRKHQFRRTWISTTQEQRSAVAAEILNLLKRFTEPDFYEHPSVQHASSDIHYTREGLSQYSGNLYEHINVPVKSNSINESILSSEAYSKLSQPSKEALSKLIRAHAIKAISFEKFMAALQATLKDALEDIMSSPPEERDYIIIGGHVAKSYNWVIALGKNVLATHPPKAILRRSEVSDYLATHKNIKHVVYLDDAAFSGTQLKDNISHALTGDQDLRVHVAIPFMTRTAIKCLKDTIDEVNSPTRYGQEQGKAGERAVNPKKLVSLQIAKHWPLISVNEMPAFYKSITSDDVNQLWVGLGAEYGVISDPSNYSKYKQTASYFEHKIPDDWSTIPVLAKIVETTSEPYKGPIYIEYLKGLEKSLPTEVKVQLAINPHSAEFLVAGIVRTEKGDFIFNKNVLPYEGSKGTLHIVRDGHEVRVPEWCVLKLQDNDLIHVTAQIRKRNGEWEDHAAVFRYQNGTLTGAHS